jgi:Arrestin (or S-antigen), N-terminal domain.
MPMSLLKDGIDNVVVTFDNESATYRAGTEMTGVIAVFCEDTTPVRGIRLKINGRLNIFWRKIDGGSTIEYTEIEDYLDRDLTVWAPNPKKRDEMWMFPGHHVYPFKFCLPIDLPIPWKTLGNDKRSTKSYICQSDGHAPVW